MAGVAARVFDEVLLMVAFCGIPDGGGGDLGDHRASPLAGGVDSGFDSLGRLFLSFVEGEDGGAVLAAYVITLTVQRGGVVHAEEPLLEQLFERQDLGIEDDFDRLGMARLAVVSVVVLRVGQPSAGVSGLSFPDAGNLAQNLFHAPEAPAGEVDGFQSWRELRCRGNGRQRRHRVGRCVDRGGFGHGSLFRRRSFLRSVRSGDGGLEENQRGGHKGHDGNPTAHNTMITSPAVRATDICGSWASIRIGGGSGRGRNGGGQT